MKGKVVIVTGATSGMGKEMARHFAQLGANVVICARTEENLRATKAEIETFDGQVLACPLDVRNHEQIAAVVAQVDATYGRIDALINNAAGNFLVKAEQLSVNGWNSVINIVLNGTFYCSHAVGNYWIERGMNGSIINIVATYAWGAGAGVVHSAAAKAGVLSLTRTLAVEWGSQYGIRVNAIAPGPIERTGGAERLFQSEAAAERTINSVPLKRLGTPEEVATLAAFLLSDGAAYINGECITIDGGQWLNPHPF